MEKQYSVEKPSVIMLAHDVSKLFGDRMRRETAKCGVNASYRPILRHLAHNEGITQLDLVKLTHLTAPSISVTLQKMEADALIRREADPKDMRQVRLYLTEEGKKLDGVFKNMAQSFDCLSMQGLSEEEIRITKECLMRIKENMLNYERGKI